MEDSTKNPKIHEYALPDGTLIDIGDVTFRAPEIMFKPALCGLESLGYHELIQNSISKCDE